MEGRGVFREQSVMWCGPVRRRSPWPLQGGLRSGTPAGDAGGSRPGGLCTAETLGTQCRGACLRISLPERWAWSSLKGSIPQVGEETGSRMGREGFQRPGVLLRRQTFGMWAGSG